MINFNRHNSITFSFFFLFLFLFFFYVYVLSHTRHTTVIIIYISTILGASSIWNSHLFGSKMPLHSYG